MKHGQRVVLTALAAVLAGVAAEAVQSAQIASKLTSEGVDVVINSPLGPLRAHLAPSSDSSGSSASRIVLPADVLAERARMHKVALVSAGLFGLLVFAVSRE